jgi:membrane protein
VRNRLYAWRFKSYEISAYQFVKALGRNYAEDEIPHRAAAVAFQLILSVFPALIFLFSLIPYIPIANLDFRIMAFLAEVMPTGIYLESAGTIKDIVSETHGSILSIGFVLTLYASTSGMMELMNAFHKMYNSGPRRTLVQGRLVAIALTVLISFALFASIVLVIVGDYVVAKINQLHLVPNEELFTWVSALVRYGVTLVVFYFALAAIYYYGPARSVRWRFFSLGATIAAVLSILATHFFGIYISEFATYNKVYGSIGTLIGFMLWVYLMSSIVLVGFEVNASLRDASQIAHRQRAVSNAPDSVL